MMLIARISSNALGLVGLLIVARLLSPDDMGLFAIAFSATVLIAATLELPTSLALIQMEDPNEDDFNTVFSINCLRGIILFALVCAFSIPIAKIYADARLVPLLLALALFPLTLSLRNPYFEQYSRDVDFSPASFLEIGAKVAAFVGSVGFALVYQSYWALVAGQLLSAATSVAITFWLPDHRPRFSLKSFNKLWSFSIWLGLSGVVNQLNLHSDRFILAGFFSKALLGFYAVAAQIVEQMLQAMLHPINWVLYSGFSKISADKLRLKNAYALAQQSIISVMLPVSIGIALVAETFVPLLLGDKWGPSVMFVQFAAPSFAFGLFAAASWALAMSLARTRLLFVRNFWSMAVRVVGQILGLVWGGLIGLLIARLVTAAITVLISMFMVRRLVGISIIQQIAICQRAVIATACMALAVIYLSPNHAVSDHMMDQVIYLAIQISIGAATYFATLLGLWKLTGAPDGPEAKAFATLHHINHAR